MDKSLYTCYKKCYDLIAKDYIENPLENRHERLTRTIKLIKKLIELKNYLGYGDVSLLKMLDL
ncbi:MAG: hypothetical protein QW272_04370 [Candidatus Methanomethylicaceae archaeon]